MTCARKLPGDRQRYTSLQVQLSLTHADPLALGAAVETGAKSGVDAFHVDVSDGSFTPELMHNLRVVSAIAAVTALPRSSTVEPST